METIKLLSDKLNALLLDEGLTDDQLREASEGLLPNIADYLNAQLRSTPLEEGKPSEKWSVEGAGYKPDKSRFKADIYLNDEYMGSCVDVEDAHRIVKTITSLQSEVERLNQSEILWFERCTKAESEVERLKGKYNRICEITPDMEEVLEIKTGQIVSVDGYGFMFGRVNTGEVKCFNIGEVKDIEIEIEENDEVSKLAAQEPVKSAEEVICRACEIEDNKENIILL